MAVETFSIRRAEDRDASSIGGVLSAAYGVDLSAYYDQATMRQVFPYVSVAKPVLLNSGRYFVAEHGDAIVACGGWSFADPSTGAIRSGIGHIRHFATHPDMGGKGVAGAVLAACCGDAYEQGVREAYCLSTLMAESFYAGQGFENVRFLRIPIGGVAFNVVEMRRRLTQN